MAKRSLDDILRPPEVPADPTEAPRPEVRRLTVSELAAHFGKSESTIWAWRSKGAPFGKDGRRTVGDPVAIQRWLDRTGAWKSGPRPTGYVPPLVDPEERKRTADDTAALSAGVEGFLDLASLESEEDDSPPETLEQELRAIGAVSRKLKRLLDAINLRALSDPKMAATFLKLVSGYTTNQARAIKIRESLEAERIRAGKLIPAEKVMDLLTRIGDAHKAAHDEMVGAVTEEVIAVLNEANIGAAFDSDIMESRVRSRAREILNQIADSIERETEGGTG